MSAAKTDGGAAAKSPNEKRGRGRPPIGVPRDEQFRAASAKRVKSLRESGLVTIQGWVSEDARTKLHALRERLGIETMGQLFEYFAKNAKRLEATEDRKAGK